jgi:hypothetical protein
MLKYGHTPIEIQPGKNALLTGDSLVTKRVNGLAVTSSAYIDLGFNQKVAFAPDGANFLGIVAVQLPSSRKLLYERFAMAGDG